MVHHRSTMRLKFFSVAKEARSCNKREKCVCRDIVINCKNRVFDINETVFYQNFKHSFFSLMYECKSNKTFSVYESS